MDWKSRVVLPCFMKGGRRMWTNYRRIILLTFPRKASLPGYWRKVFIH